MFLSIYFLYPSINKLLLLLLLLLLPTDGVMNLSGFARQTN